MLKALFFDMDDTLCDTQSANERARQQLAEAAQAKFALTEAGARAFSAAYLKGIYREWEEGQEARYMPVIKQHGEGAFRVQLVKDLLAQQGVAEVADKDGQWLQDKFDHDRIAAYDFFPGVLDFLTDARKYFTLVVITNGPEYSQLPKVQAVNLAEHVDHILIGGLEPEQKPARSIFEKALQLANCEAHEAIHLGDSLAADIAGARNSCITSVWIQHQQPLDAELGIHPDHTLLHPSEIPALIRQLHPF